MPGSTHQISKILRKCKHVPKTTAERNLKPQDCFCEECQVTCCRDCFTNDHITHEHSNKEHSQRINLIRKLSPDDPKVQDEIAKIISPELKKVIAAEAMIRLDRFKNPTTMLKDRK